MDLRKALVLGAAVAIPAISGQVHAKVDAAEAAKLGGELTAVGGVAGANADGSIPKWTGPADFTDAQRNYSYKDVQAMSREEQDKLLNSIPSEAVETITAANMDKWADKLTEGHKAMLKKYPTYKMNVVKSIRSGFYPKAIEEATKKNATTAFLKSPDSLQKAELGFPFPIPTSGPEPIWNHKIKFRGDAVTRYNNQAIVKTDGAFKVTKVIEEVKFKYANLSQPGKAKDNILFYYLQTDLGAAATRTLVHEFADQTKKTRGAWLYNKGFGRLKRAPNVGYDNPSQTSDGEQFNDQVDMFNGAMDLYDWKLVGRKEMVIPYNSGKINSPLLKYKDILAANHINQDLARYELHRVWVVEATLKRGKKHTFGKRVFYVDEDGWSIAAVDCYDGRNQLYKLQEGHLISIPMIGSVTAIPELIYDLQSGRYFATAMVNEEKPNDFDVKFKDKYFKPASVSKRIK